MRASAQSGQYHIMVGLRVRTMGEDHGGEGVPKAGADLVQWMAAKVFVDAVLEDPYDECHDEEEAACEGP